MKVWIVLLAVLMPSAVYACGQYQIIDHGDSVEVICTDQASSRTSSGASSPGTVQLRKGAYLNHNRHSSVACSECHASANGGKITGFNKDMAHNFCKGCHVDRKAGPVSCKDCHSGGSSYSSSSSPAPAPETTYSSSYSSSYEAQRNREEQQRLQAQNDLDAEELRSKKLERFKERSGSKHDPVHIPKITERNYIFKNGIRIDKEKDVIR